MFCNMFISILVFIKSIIKYVPIMHLFDIEGVNIFLCKLDQLREFDVT